MPWCVSCPVGSSTSNPQKSRLNDAGNRIEQSMPTDIATAYDFIVCGSGSSGSVVAGRLAENPAVRILVLEAGGSDDVPQVMDPGQWFLNYGSEREWGFVAERSASLNGRSVPQPMARILGGGSSINAMAWARGHRSDWDEYAADVDDPSWGYKAVLETFREIEDWHGPSESWRRGVGGPIFIESAPDPHPVAIAAIEGARTVGIPTYDSVNGVMMENWGGAALTDINVRAGIRNSVFRSYLHPYVGRPNVTVATGTLVTRLTLDGNRVTGVEFSRNGSTHRVSASYEVVLSLGAINTPKVLMQSGIGDAEELQSHGIDVVNHLPGVGRNLQDHVLISCVWESPDPLRPHNNAGEALVFWKSRPELEAPDIQICLAEVPLCSPEVAARYPMPDNGWTMCGTVLHPRSRGTVRLGGPGPNDPVVIEANILADEDDMSAAVAVVELCREIANSAPVKPFAKREVTPGPLRGGELKRFIRDAASSFSHQTCTAKMGRDEMSVVDGALKVYGAEHLRIADGSVLSRITSGNTMAPCVVIGERAAAIIKDAHRL